MILQDAHDIYNNVNGQKVKDPQLNPDFDAAKAHRDAHPDSIPSFAPSSKVFAQGGYGFQVFQDYAALSATEYEELVGHPPTHLKLKPMPLPLKAPGTNSILYAIDLHALPAEHLHSVRKVRVYFENCVNHQEIYVDPRSQLYAEHGTRIYKHLVALHNDSRPSSIQVGTDRPKDLNALIREHQQKDAASTEALSSMKEEADDDEDEDADDDDEEATPAIIQAPARRLGFSGGSLAPQAPSAKKKTVTGAKGSQQKGGKGKSKGKGSSPWVPETEAETAEEIQSTSKKGSTKQTKREMGVSAVLETLDEELQLVAEKHLKTGGASITSLESLRPDFFLLKDDLEKKTRSSIINGV